MAASVFISSKSEDYKVAGEVYHYLTKRGFECFFSEETLLQVGETDYKNVIDEALDNATHLVLVTSSRANAESKWVKYEWNSFDNEILAGRKDGNLVVVIYGAINKRELPYALRRRQAFLYESQLDRLPAYLREKKAADSSKREAPPQQSVLLDAGDSIESNPDHSRLETYPASDEARGIAAPTALPDGRWLWMWMAGSVIIAIFSWMTWRVIYENGASGGIFMVIWFLPSLASAGIFWYLLTKCWKLSLWWFAVVPLMMACRWIQAFIYEMPYISTLVRPESGLSSQFRRDIALLIFYGILVGLPQSFLLRRQLGGRWWWFGANIALSVLESFVFTSILPRDAGAGFSRETLARDRSFLLRQQ